MKAENTVTDKLLLSMKKSEKGGFGLELTVQSWKKKISRIFAVVFQENTVDPHMLHHHCLRTWGPVIRLIPAA